MDDLLQAKAVELFELLLCHRFMCLPVCVGTCPELLSCSQLHFSACLAPADMKPFTESITRERQQLNSSMETLFPVMLSEWQQHFAVFVQVSTDLMDTVLISYEACVKVLSHHSLCMPSAIKIDTSICAQAGSVI